MCECVCVWASVGVGESDSESWRAPNGCRPDTSGHGRWVQHAQTCVRADICNKITAHRQADEAPIEARDADGNTPLMLAAEAPRPAPAERGLQQHPEAPRASVWSSSLRRVPAAPAGVSRPPRTRPTPVRYRTMRQIPPKSISAGPKPRGAPRTGRDPLELHRDAIPHGRFGVKRSGVNAVCLLC